MQCGPACPSSPWLSSVSWSHCQLESHLKALACPLPCPWLVCLAKLVLAPQSCLPVPPTKGSGRTETDPSRAPAARGRGLHPPAGRSFTAVAPALLAPGTGFTDRGGDGFGMIRTPHVYCALCFCHQHTAVCNETLCHSPWRRIGEPRACSPARGRSPQGGGGQ